MIAIAPDRLIEIVAAVFAAAGAPTEDAQLVAESLVEANLVGHDSHGVLRVGAYVDWIRSGQLDPRAELKIARQSATTAVLDGGNGFGQVVAAKAMQLAVDKARLHDMGMVAVRHCGHTGRLGTYALQAAAQGCLGMVFGSGSNPGGLVAPFHGSSRLLNTNPTSWAVPAEKHPPVFLDFATSICAQGKVQAALDKGLPLPAGWLLDAQGRPTTDPAEQMRGGVLLPFGEHKGYCMGFLIELITSGFSGQPCAPFPDYERDYPTVLMAINIDAFEPLDEFRRAVDQLVDAAHAARRARDDEEILVPGEIEWRTRAERLANGLYLPDATWNRIVATGALLGYEVTL